MSVWMRIASGFGIASLLGLLAFAWMPDPSSPQFFATAGWAAAKPSNYVSALGVLLLFTGMTANDGFAILEGGWLALLVFRLPAWLWWALPSSDISLALPYVHTAMGCWIAFFLLRHGDRFVYAAGSILTLPFFLVPGIGPAINRWHSKVFGLRRASEQPPGDSE